MANPTTNFGWVMPTATDLVTDLPADFAVFGQGVDTSMAYLLGGTTGQILSKTSGTNMAFTWINNDQGDITGITATSPLTGGGSSGAITVGIQDATTSVKGSVQLSDSTSTTSSVLAATPTAVKSAYDLANGAIPKTLTTTTGDVIYASAANTPARLGIGSTSQVLTVAGGVPSWATPAVASSGLTFIASASPSASAAFTISNCFSATYRNYLILADFSSAAYGGLSIRLNDGSDITASNYNLRGWAEFTGTFGGAVTAWTGTQGNKWDVQDSFQVSGQVEIKLFSPFATKVTGINYTSYGQENATTAYGIGVNGTYNATTSATGITFTMSASTITGNFAVYGIANS